MYFYVFFNCIVTKRVGKGQAVKFLAKGLGRLIRYASLTTADFAKERGEARGR